jgi:putative peptidoglycan lipid II flippase
LAPGFYARQDIRTPVKIAIGVLIATQLMNLGLVPILAHAGLALSIGLGACLNAGFLFWGLRTRGVYVPDPGWTIFLVRLVGGLFLLAGTAMWLGSQFDWFALQARPLVRIGVLSGIVAICGAIYFGALMLMGFRFADFKRTTV